MIASHNKGKIAEFEQMLKPFGVKVYSALELNLPDVEETGKTFVEYLNGIRTSHAKNLLLTTNISVTDIAYECGFGSIRTLNREFLKKYGCSLTEYKKNYGF